MPETTKPQLDAMGLPTDEKAREVAIGRMLERLSRVDEAEARKQAELEEAAKQAPREQATVKIEWLKSPQRGSCQISSKAGPVRYDPKPHKGAGACAKDCRHGPVTQKATGRTLKPGTVELVPADHARVIVEAQYARVVEGYEHVLWTDSDQRTGIDTTHPDPGDEKQWQALSA